MDQPVYRNGANDPRAGEKRELRWVLEMAVLTLLTIFIETMLVPALPNIAEDLAVGSSDLAWILTAYTLAGAITIPIAGKMGEVWGRKRVLTALMAIYAVSIIGAAVSSDFTSLIVFRTIQGVGMGAMPLLLGMAKDVLPVRMMPVGLGIISSMVGVGTAMGLVIGGLLISAFGWNGVFWIVLPFVVLLIGIINRSVPDVQTKRQGKMDIVGSALLGSGLLTLLLVLSQGSAWGWSSAPAIGLLVCSVISFVAFAVRERNYSEPIVKFELMRNRNILTAYTSMLFFGMIMFMLYQTLPYFLEMPSDVGGFGITSQVIIGLFFLPNAIMQMVFSTLGAKFGQKIGHWRVLVIGLGIVVVGLLALSVVRSSAVGILIAMAVFGMGMGSATVGNTNMLSTSCSKEDFGSATAVNAMIMTVGMSIGPVVASLFTEGFADASTGYAYCWITAALIALFTAVFILANRRKLGIGLDGPVSPEQRSHGN